MTSTKIIAEIGINHNGDMDKAKRLIDIAAVAGCDYAKLQKRNPDVCVPEEQKNLMRKVPWNNEEITYLQYKKDIEFSVNQYKELKGYAKSRGIILFASVWDVDSAKDLAPIFDTVKIPSACITDYDLLKYCDENYFIKMMSTGMSTEKEIDIAANILDPDVIFHTNSSYPSKVEDLRLQYLLWLKWNHKERDIGYSNHFFGLTPCFAAVALGASYIEVHICEDHRDWGSDQSSSVEPVGLIKLVKGIRDLELALSKGYEHREVYPEEFSKRNSLRNK